jgi:hypothetical protein
MAHNLIVAYELRQPATHDASVQQAIKSLGSWAYFETWVFYLRSEYSAAEARNQIWTVMQSGDKLFVAEASNAAWQGIEKEISDFILQHWLK